MPSGATKECGRKKKKKKKKYRQRRNSRAKERVRSTVDADWRDPGESEPRYQGFEARSSPLCPFAAAMHGWATAALHPIPRSLQCDDDGDDGIGWDRQATAGICVQRRR